MAFAHGVDAKTASTQMTKDELFLSHSKEMSGRLEQTIAQIRAQAKAHREYLARSIKISEKIEEGDVQVATIHLKRSIEQLRIMIYGHTPTSQPMRRVPLEILGHIFQHHV